MAINPDATVIPDKAEVWLALKSDVSSLSAMTPTTAVDNLVNLGWEFCGLIDDAKGIPLDPSVEVKPYDAFGHPQFRVKLRKGTLKSGFTVLEVNDVTSKFVLPGSVDGKIGRPGDVQAYVLYRFADEDTAHLWMTLRPAPLEVKSHGGIIDGELSFAEMVVHHTADSNGDVFKTLTGAVGSATIGDGDA